MWLNKIKETIFLAVQLTVTGILMTLAVFSSFIVVPYMMIKYRHHLRTMCSGKQQICSEEL